MRIAMTDRKEFRGHLMDERVTNCVSNGNVSQNPPNPFTNDFDTLRSSPKNSEVNP